MQSLMRYVLVLVILVFVVGCAAKQAPTTSPHIKVEIDYDLLADKIVERLQNPPPKELEGMITNPSNGHRYVLINKEMAWYEAKAYAERLGGYLATITSVEEQSWICQNFSGTRYWLGGTDEAVEGDWRWITGEKWDYTNWNVPSEPNDFGTGEDALELDNTGLWNTNGLWNDLSAYTLTWTTSLLVEFDSLND